MKITFFICIVLYHYELQLTCLIREKKINFVLNVRKTQHILHHYDI